MNFNKYLIYVLAFVVIWILETIMPLFKDRDNRWRHIFRNFIF